MFSISRQLRLLLSEPIFHEAQGFLFARAISTAAIGEMLALKSQLWLEDVGR